MSFDHARGRARHQLVVLTHDVRRRKRPAEHLGYGAERSFGVCRFVDVVKLSLDRAVDVCVASSAFRIAVAREVSPVVPTKAP